MSGKLTIRHLKHCSFRMTLFMIVIARGGWLEPEVLWIRRDQAAAPVNLPKVLRNTSWYSLILLDTSSSYFDLSIILHLKFCCIFIACCILMTTIDHTITVTVPRSKLIRSGSDLTKSHDGMNHSWNRVRKADQILILKSKSKRKM